jgi:transcriptional regulator with XRE-family HTH domain
MTDSRSKKLQKRFGDRVRQLREEKGLTKTALADLIGKERQDIWAIEIGDRNVTFSTIIILAQALEVTPADLMKFKLD